jgi:hypothetical protein
MHPSAIFIEIGDIAKAHLILIQIDLFRDCDTLIQYYTTLMEPQMHKKASLCFALLVSLFTSTHAFNTDPFYLNHLNRAELRELEYQIRSQIRQLDYDIWTARVTCVTTPLTYLVAKVAVTVGLTIAVNAVLNAILARFQSDGASTDNTHTTSHIFTYYHVDGYDSLLSDLIEENRNTRKRCHEERKRLLRQLSDVEGALSYCKY